ncbi:MAG: alpha-2-macroglobulin [Alphaproteobacteria bacterium]
MRFLKALLGPLFVVLFFVGAAAPSHAYVDDELSRDAEQMRSQLLRKFDSRIDTDGAMTAWGEGQKLAKLRNFAGALPHYERAAGLGLNDPAFWMDFNIVLGSQRPPDNRRAVAAAYLAYLTADSEARKAGALFYIGYHFEALRAFEQAMLAYEAGLEIDSNDQIENRLKQLAAQYRMTLKRVYAESDSEQPRVCLEFSRPLAPRDKVKFEDFVRFQPAIKANFVPTGQTLCAEGVVHGQTYQVTVLKGVPDNEGSKLTRNQEFKVAVADRAPMVAFKSGNYILPKNSRQGVPVISVNVEVAELKLLRVNDRNLINEIVEGRIRKLLYGDDIERIADTAGELVWKGQVDIKSDKNKQVTTAIPFDKVIKDLRPGIYVLQGAPFKPKGDRYRDQSTQWIVVTDLGLSTYWGGDGLNVFVRSYTDAEPKRRMEVRLIARNNTVLATAKTDSDGRVTFAPGLVRGTGGLQPAAVMVYDKESDFSFLDLGGPAFDLSDRGVDGRELPGPVDAFLYTERGVYRPGETVHLVTLLRDEKAMAIEKTPITLKVMRPDGVEARRYTLQANDLVGGYLLNLPTAKSAPSGRWTVNAYIDPKGAAIGSVRFQVEDFVPERLDFSLEPETKFLEPGKPNAVTLNGRWLYGAPAADLNVEGEFVLKSDPNPYPEFRGYYFGLQQETFQPKRIELPTLKTDADGKVRVPLALDAPPDTTRALKAEIRLSLLEPGGRASSRVIAIPVRAQDLVIGIKPASDDDSVQENQPAAFEVIALDKEGKRRATGELEFEFIRENYQVQWFQRNGSWQYRVIQRDESLQTGKVTIAADKPAKLQTKVQWGRYRLEVRDPGGKAATSYRFYAGWFYTGEDNPVPDKLTVKLDKPSYKPGQRAEVFIRPPFDGQVLVVVASDRIHYVRNLEVDAKGRTIDIKVDESWGPGVYVTATAFRAADTKAQRGPQRAIGVAFLGRDFGERTLGVKLEAPEKIKPRQNVDVTVKVTGAARDKAFVTLAAVDEGILLLTNFKTPAPDQHYYSRRKLGVELRDDYGRLIDAYAGQLGTLRTGGDGTENRHLGGLDASSIRTVALFSGIVKLDRDGVGKISFAVPDFNGKLRLMAVAYDAKAVGKAESPLIVRDNVVSLVTLPRFLAPGDEGRLSVSLHNVDGDAGDYKVSMTAKGVASIAGPAEINQALAKDARTQVNFALKGDTIGVATVTLQLSGPNSFKIERSWDIAVRPSQPISTRQITRQLDPNASATYSNDLIAEFLPGTAKVSVSLSTFPDLDVAGLIKSLDQYPYGCAEQTTSVALPLLYLADVAQAVGVAADDKILRDRVQNAIGRLMILQRSDGSIGLWSPLDVRQDWLTVYIMDFLSQAKQKGYFVPDLGFERGMERLSVAARSGNYELWTLPTRAYAFYVLAMNKKAEVADLRYLHDNYLNLLPTALAKAQLGAALALYGDTARSGAAFAAARDHKTRPNLTGRYWDAAWRDYGSYLRDISGVLYYSSVTPQQSQSMPTLLEVIVDLKNKTRYTSTQEKAWLLLAAHALSSKQPLKVNVAGKDIPERQKPYYANLLPKDLAQNVSVKNNGTERIWTTVTVSGIPSADLPPESQGFTIKRSYYTLDGRPADLTKVRQGDTLVAVINGEATGTVNHQAMIVDLLPAGFEIENARLEGGRALENLKWLKELTPLRYIEARDDRFVAAADLEAKTKRFTAAYIVRAVTPGTYKLPGAFVEDMYAPNYFARDALSSITVQPRN